MQIDDAIGKITDPEVKSFIEKVIKDQNSYTTKLEAQLKDLSSKQGTPGNGVDEVTAKYLEKNMRRDVIAEAEMLIKKDIPAEVFEAVKADWLEFLDKGMSKQKTTVEFAADAFSLVYGKCMRNKEHAVNKLGKSTTPSETPAPSILANAGTNSAKVQDVQNILAKQPPIMTGNDPSSATGVPDNSNPVKNTRDAFASLKSRFAQQGGSRFQ